METKFSISNTDVITMLVVKNRENLEKQKAELFIEKTELDEKLANSMKQQWDKIVKNANKDILDAYEKLIRLLNPKLKFKISLNEPDFRWISCNYRGKDEIVYKIEFLDYFPDFEGDWQEEEKFLNINGDGDSSLYLPINKTIKVKNNPRIDEICKKIDEINNLLKNEDKLKEKLIAQVTENAIQNLPELKELTMNIPMLSLNS